MPRMRIVTIKLPEDLLEKIDKALMFLGFAHRSELIRTAIVEYLLRHNSLFEEKELEWREEIVVIT